MNRLPVVLAAFSGGVAAQRDGHHRNGEQMTLDARLVPLVLVLAAMRLMREANWWLPGFLDRRLPAVSFGDEARGRRDDRFE